MKLTEEVVIGTGVFLLMAFLAAEFIWRPHYNAVHHCHETGRIMYGAKGMAAFEYHCDDGFIWEN